MTDNDKALVKRLRDESIVGMPMENEAADRIEAQAAEIESLKTMIFATGEAAATNLRTAMERAAEIERLREAGNKLNFFAGHAEYCCNGLWTDPVACDCGYTNAWKTWRAALGETE